MHMEEQHFTTGTGWGRMKAAWRFIFFWRYLLLASLLAVAIPVVYHPDVHWRLIGWWQGEAFYQGRPTSWWATEVSEYEYSCKEIDWHCWIRIWSRTEQPVFTDRLKAVLLGRPALQRIRILPLVVGDPNALPVLGVCPRNALWGTKLAVYYSI